MVASIYIVFSVKYRSVSYYLNFEKTAKGKYECHLVDSPKEQIIDMFRMFDFQKPKRIADRDIIRTEFKFKNVKRKAAKP